MGRQSQMFLRAPAWIVNMDKIMKVINAVKDGYIEAADWVSAHPHWTIWGALAAIGVAAAVF